jgi:hypothetical protein
MALDTLVEGIARILDKGVAIDTLVRSSLAGTEILTLKARVVLASVETLPKPQRWL